MTIDYAALKTEILLPAYSVPFAAGNDVGVAALLNAVNQAIDITRTLVPTWEVVSATVPGEYLALSAINQNLYIAYVSAGVIDASNANVRAGFNQMFTVGTTTRTNLIALLTRKGSRAEQLFGIGTLLVTDDIAKARAS